MLTYTMLVYIIENEQKGIGYDLFLGDNFIIR